jgi:hypothetical protein
MALVEAKVEGPVRTISPDGSGGVIIFAMGNPGVRIMYTPGPVIAAPPVLGAPPQPVRQRSIRTPSQRITVAQLVDGASLPGRIGIDGFEGGTIIAEGFYSTDTVNGQNVFLANHIFVEPAETVLIGAVTGNNGTAIQVNTIEVVPLTDPRISTNPPDPSKPLYLNDSGFVITLDSITPTPTTTNPPTQLPTAVEGYFADGKLFAHAIEFGGPGLLAPLADPALPIDFPRISIERAQIRDRGTSFEIEVRGHITAPPPLTQTDHRIELRVLDMKAGTFGTVPIDWQYRGSEQASELTQLGIGQLRVDLRTNGGIPVQQVPPIQRWRFRGNLPKSGIHLLPPERIEARNATAEDAVHLHVREEADTDVRDE